MNRSPYIIAGIVAANAVGATMIAICYGLSLLLADVANMAMIVVYPSLFLVPLAMGIAASFFWIRAGIGAWGDLLACLASLSIAIAGAWYFLHEGTVCLLIVSPILLAGMIGGAIIGRTWLRRREKKLYVLVLPALLLLAPAELFTRRDHAAVVADEIRINARPEQVFAHVTAFGPIPEPPRFWLFRAGLPSPSSTTTSGNFVGADRKCIFSNGLVFGETVAEIVPNELLTFDIVDQPADPELLGHLTLHRGQFALRDNHDGTTTLIGRSWYTLHVRPLWYFDWWTCAITRQVHLRVMQHIKQLAEARA